MAETTTVTMPQISEQPSQPGDAHAISNTPVAAGTPAVTGQAAEQAPAPVRVPLNKLYALPVPVRTFPLPSFYPSNPISLFHLVYTWLTQVIFPPAPEPSVIHQGVWDPDTHSVHVEDSKSIRALWEQGFFGKGSLSRSEPNWFKRELSRRGAAQGSKVSEQYTEARREERRLLKWERAKVELEALERQRQEEAQSNGVPPFPQEFAVNGTSEEAPCVVKKPKNVVVEDEVELNTDSQNANTTNGQTKHLEATILETIPGDNFKDVILAGTSSVETVPLAQVDAQDEPPVSPTTGGYFDDAQFPEDSEISEAASVAVVVESVTEEVKHIVELVKDTITDVLGEFKAPVTPAGILALPNSLVSLVERQQHDDLSSVTLDVQPGHDQTVEPLFNNAQVETKAPVGPAELLALPNSLADLVDRQARHGQEWKIIDQIQSPVKSLVESAIKPPVESALDEVPRVARAPVGPAELLALPNSSAELISEWQLVEHVEPVVESTTDNLSNGHVEESKSPVGPAELLALPNSSADLAPKPVVAKHASVPSSVESDQSTPAASSTQGQANGLEDAKAVNGVLETPALVNGANGHGVEANAFTNGSINGVLNGSISPVPSLPSTNGVTEARPIQHKELTPMKRRKSVRFSPRVVSTTFQHFDPPSPSRSIVAASRSTAPVPAPFVPTVPVPQAAEPTGPLLAAPVTIESTTATETKVPPPAPAPPSPVPVTDSAIQPSAHVGELKDKEHFQLAPEEAFFLSFGLGALTVVDPVTRAPIPQISSLPSFEHILISLLGPSRSFVLTIPSLCSMRHIITFAHLDGFPVMA